LHFLPLLVHIIFILFSLAAAPMAAYTPAAGDSRWSKPHPRPEAQIETALEEKGARTPAQRKISSRLLYAVKVQRGELIDSGNLMRRSGVKVDPDGTTLVDIKAEVTEAVLARIRELGGTVISSFPRYQSIRARIPLDQIDVLAEMPQILFVRPPEEGIAR